MARTPKRWSERSARSQRRILNQFRAAGLSNRQIREGVNRGSLRPYAREPQNRASAGMRRAHPGIGLKFGGYGSRGELYAAAQNHMANVLADRGRLNADRLADSWQAMAAQGGGNDVLAVAVLGMNADRIARLAEAGNDPKELAKRLGSGLSESGLGWRDDDDEYHNPFWYH